MAGGAGIHDGQGIQIAESGLTRISDRIASARAEFTGLSSQLSGQLAHLPRVWSGVGGSAFTRLHAEWQSRHAEITRALQQFEDALATTQRDASANDETQSGSLLRITSNLQQI